MFDDQCCEEIGFEDTNILICKHVFFQKLRELFCLSHKNLKVFASVLLMYKSTASIALEFLKEYSKLLIWLEQH